MTIYYGSQFVHRSRDGGASWETISPDLTTNTEQWHRQEDSGGLTYDVTGAENYGALVALAPSMVDPDVVWAGSDDGRIHVTTDGGKEWRSVEGNLNGVPVHTWVPHIAPSSTRGRNGFHCSR